MNQNDLGLFVLTLVGIALAGAAVWFICSVLEAYQQDKQREQQHNRQVIREAQYWRNRDRQHHHRPPTPQPRSNVRPKPISPPRSPAIPPTRSANGRQRIRVARDQRAWHETKGWQRNGTWLRGTYQTRLGSFTGEVDVSDSKEPLFYINNPPPAVLSGPHAACFHPRGHKKYFVHFSRKHRNVEAGISAVEKLIADALTPKRSVI